MGTIRIIALIWFTVGVLAVTTTPSSTTSDEIITTEIVEEVEKIEPKKHVAEKPLSPITVEKKEPAPARPAISIGGNCAKEVAKYPWPQAVAQAVMLAESGGVATELNNNPSTGDYSVGCMQINLYGANAYSRPSETWLKNAANNVKWAYENIYAPCGCFSQWGAYTNGSYFKYLN